MTLSSPLFHRQNQGIPITGREVEQILRPLYERIGSKMLGTCSLVFLASIVGNIVLRSCFESVRSLPYVRNLFWIPLFIGGLICCARRFPPILKYGNLQEYLKNNGSPETKLSEIMALYPKEKGAISDILSRMNFLQLRNARAQLGQSYVKELMQTINTVALNLWRSIDLITEEKDPAQKIVRIQNARLKPNPLLAFELDHMCLRTLPKEEYQAVNTELCKVFPEMERIVVTDEKDSKQRALRKAYVEHFAEGLVGVALKEKKCVPDMEGIEPFILFMEGNEGPFDMNTWLQVVRFADKNSQKRMLAKLDALLSMNICTLTEVELEQFSQLMKNEISRDNFHLSLTKLYGSISLYESIPFNENLRFLNGCTFDYDWNREYHFLHRFPCQIGVEKLGNIALTRLGNYSENQPEWKIWVDRCDRLFCQLSNRSNLLKIELQKLPNTQANAAIVHIFGAIED